MVSRRTALVIGVIVILLVTLIVYFTWPPRRPSIRDVWVINLESASDRWNHIETTYTGTPVLHRWNATHGKTTTRDEAFLEGVDYRMSRSCSSSQDVQSEYVLKNVGVIGCWLSHKRLLRHLAQQDAHKDDGHLICEDDIDFHKTWVQEWTSLAQAIPGDWDMVYLGINQPKGNQQIAPRIFKGRVLERADGNWGTYAYLVRHGSIPKILATLRFMTHPIDVQYNFHFDSLNVYIIAPELLKPNEVLSAESSVRTE